MFKNEVMILEEWIDHYINEGVDCFLLIDNGSTDGYEAKLQKYIDAGYVILNKNPKRYAQVEIYNSCIGCARKFDWTMIMDLDEFVYARNGFDTIKEYLGSLDPNITQIHIPWKMFGSSGFIEQPKSVIDSFTWRENYENPRKKECKCIMRGNLVNILHIHHSLLDRNSSSRDIFPNNFSFTKQDINFIENLTENVLSDSFLHLNHYAIQSWEFFSKIKMTRGDVTQSGWDNLRNKNYFDSYDHKGLEDDELKNKQYKNHFSLIENPDFTKENILTKNIEIVVSRYNETLDWISSYPFNQFQYTVYNKGINDNFNKKNVKRIIPLKNVGVCDHTYLYHIISNYDDNSLKPITIFLPGSVNMPNKINKSVELVKRVLLSQQAFFIGQYTKNVFHLFKDFNINNYKPGYIENVKLNNGGELIKSRLRPYGMWYLYNFGKVNVSYFTMNGIFSINKKDVMKHRKFRYEKILNQISLGPNMEVAHYMERSWGAIFYPLIHTKKLLSSYNNPLNITNPIKTNRIQMKIGGIRQFQKTNVRANIARNNRARNYIRAVFKRQNGMQRKKRLNIYLRSNRV